MKNPLNTIVIIGGMGPQASAEAHRRLVSMIASRQLSMPEIIVLSIPVPDFISSTANVNQALPLLKQEIAKVSAFEPSVVMIACNTAHILFDDLRLAFPELPLVSLTDSVMKHIGQYERVGLLASPTTIATQLYQNLFDAAEVECIIPDPAEQAQLETIIRAVIDGQLDNRHTTNLQQLIDRQFALGCDGVLLGCTELPVALNDGMRPNVCDSLTVLCETLIDASQNKL